VHVDLVGEERAEAARGLGDQEQRVLEVTG
jgi:hypothetical protein